MFDVDIHCIYLVLIIALAGIYIIRVLGAEFLKNNIAVFLLFATWIASVGYGYSMLIHYGLKPNSRINNLASWPQQSKLLLDKQLNTLVVFIHPKCPCSRATLVELDRLLVNANNKLKVIAVFIQPVASDADWSKTDLWQQAGLLKGVQRYIDKANLEAGLFNATTSGEVYLFKPNGGLVYHGGITAGRGHEGDNAGRSAIVTYVRSGKIMEPQGYAYGCSI